MYTRFQYYHKQIYAIHIPTHTKISIFAGGYIQKKNLKFNKSFKKALKALKAISNLG